MPPPHREHVNVGRVDESQDVIVVNSLPPGLDLPVLLHHQGVGERVLARLLGLGGHLRGRAVEHVPEGPM